MWVPSQLLCPGLASLLYRKWHGPGNEASPGQLPRLAPVEVKRLHGLALSETGHIRMNSTKVQNPRRYGGAHSA